MDVAVLLPQRTIAKQGSEAEVEELGESAGFGIKVVGETRTVEATEEGGELDVELGRLVGVLLVGADYVWGGGVGVVAGSGGWGDGGRRRER